MTPALCTDCGVKRNETHRGYGHDERCCDCFDLSCGMPLHQLYQEVKTKLAKTEKALALARAENKQAEARIKNLEEVLEELDHRPDC